MWVKHKINNFGEALPEAYVKTDFSKIDDEMLDLQKKNKHLKKHIRDRMLRI